MKKYVVIFFAGIVVATVFMIVNSRQEIILIEDRDSIKSFHINGIRYDDEADVKNIINILEKYDTERTREPYPSKSSEIEVEIDYLDNFNPRHIILGKVNIVYDSADKAPYKIVNGDKLLLEIENYLGDK